jgi:hypothetical protein
MSHGTTTSRRSIHDLATERVVLDQFIAEPRWSREGLHVALEHVDAAALGGALVGLLVEGLLIRDGVEWLLAPCVRHLDALGLLAPAAPNGSPPRAPDAAALDRILRRSAEERSR